jgi:D-glycero-D-manno-heptose 1,7-bisphosphate phosphatase
LIDEAEVRALQGEVEVRLGESLDGFYFCPHHPKATLPAYRQVCDCRKPRAGLLLRAATEHGIYLPASFMVGDRPTDIQAGARVGCRTIWVETGRHLDPPIETSEALPPPRPDHVCADLLHAARWILNGGQR